MWFVILFLYREFVNTWSDDTQTDYFNVYFGRSCVLLFLVSSHNECGYFRHLVLQWNKSGWVETSYVFSVLHTVALQLLVSLITFFSISFLLLHDVVSFRFSHLMFFVIKPSIITIVTQLSVTSRNSEFFHSFLWLNILIVLRCVPGLKYCHFWSCRNTSQDVQLAVAFLPSRNVHIPS